MHWLKRGLAAAVALLSVGISVPAGALTGEVPPQSVPSVVSPDQPIPGTARNVSLVGHLAPPGLTGSTPAGEYGALAIAGDCAYIGRRNFNSSGQAENGLGVQIVDITRPNAPQYRGTIPGTVFADSTARELRAVVQDRLLIILQYSKFTGGGVNEAGASTGGSNVLQAYRINRDCSATHLGDYNMGPLKPHEFYTWIDPRVPGRVIAYVTTPFGPGELAVLDFSPCSAVPGAPAPTSCTPSLLTLWDGAYPQPSGAAISNSGIGNYLHSIAISPDGRTGYMAFWNGGFFTVDTSQVADGRANPLIVGEASTSPRDDWSAKGTGQGGDAHSAVWVPADLSRASVKPYVVLTDEDYLGIGDCPFGWLHIDRLQALAGGLNLPVPLSTYGLKENLLQQEAAVIANGAGQTSRLNGPLGDPGTCSGYTRDHASEFAQSGKAYIGDDASWPGGKVPANTYSSHNPTTLPDLVLLTWYGGGFQVVDIHDPAHPAEAGYYVPRPEAKVAEEMDDSSGTFLGCYFPQAPDAVGNNCTIRDAAQNTVAYRSYPQVEGWSYPIIQDGLIYFVDNRNGLYIVDYDGRYGSEVGKTRFAEGNSNNSAALLSARPVAGAATAAAAPAAAAGAATAAAAGGLRTSPAGHVLPWRLPTVPLGLAIVLVAALAWSWGLRRRRSRP